MTKRKDPYLKALVEIRDDKSVVPTDKTADQLQTEIAEISAELRGPMPNYERIFLIEARTQRRKQLAAMEAATP